MKQLFITVLLSFAVVAGTLAAPRKVSAAILANFEAEFKKATEVTWLLTPDYTKAAFTADDVKMEVYYDANGDVIATSKGITLDDLPMSAKRSFDKKFAGYHVSEVIRLEGFGETAYYVSGENEKDTVIFKVNEDNQVSCVKRTKK